MNDQDSGASTGADANAGTGPASWILDLRQRLSSPPPQRLQASEARSAAVLVPLYVDAGQLWTVLTKRSETLPHHRGQIAFPGGTNEVGEDAWQTALRETEEEIGIESRKVLKLGELDEMETPTGFRIVPCVGVVPAGIEPVVNEEEIAEVFRVPLLAFADVRMAEDRAVTFDGVERMIRIYHVAGRQVWGLTARIIQSLMWRLGIESPVLTEGESG
jgi:8-oxo-dGTP pyrophosphatase MutT (NUDIX family)